MKAEKLKGQFLNCSLVAVRGKRSEFDRGGQTDAEFPKPTAPGEMHGKIYCLETAFDVKLPH